MREERHSLVLDAERIKCSSSIGRWGENIVQSSHFRVLFVLYFLLQLLGMDLMQWPALRECGRQSKPVAFIASSNLSHSILFDANAFWLVHAKSSRSRTEID